MCSRRALTRTQAVGLVAAYQFAAQQAFREVADALIARARHAEQIAAQLRGVIRRWIAAEQTTSATIPSATPPRLPWRAFLGSEPCTPAVTAAAVPVRNEDLTGLPPALIGARSIDLFVDEDMEYARCLIDSGVATELTLVPGGFHASTSCPTSSACGQGSQRSSSALG